MRNLPLKSPFRVLRRDVTFLLTNRCSNRCRHCIPQSGSQLAGELNTGEVIRSLSNIRSCFDTSRIALSGGEPLLRRSFAEVYETAADLFSISLFSSGVGLSPDAESVLRSAPPAQFIASLYGLLGSHDAFCDREGAFEDVERCLRLFREFGSPTAVNLVCHRANLPEVPQVIDRVREKGLADTVKILVFSPLGRGKDIMSLSVGNSEWLSFADRVQEYVMARCPDFAQSIEIERHVRTRGAKGRGAAFGCAVAADRNGIFSSCIHIDANGDIFPCVMLLRDHRFRLGNILRPEEIDLASYYRRVDDACSVARERTCACCPVRDSCSGGCLGYHLALGRDHRCEGLGFDLGCPARYGPLV